MSTDTRSYRQELLMALRMRDVPGARIAEALAEVDSHVAETGEDPVEAFGPPKAYANQLAGALGVDGGVRPFWRGVLTWRTAAHGAGGAGGSWLVIDGASALAGDGRRVLTLPPVLAIVIGVAVLAGMAFDLRGLTRRSQDRVLDPRTGADMAPPLPSWALPLMLSVPAILVLVAVGLPLMLSVPAIAVLVAVGITVAVRSRLAHTHAATERR